MPRPLSLDPSRCAWHEQPRGRSCDRHQLLQLLGRLPG
jgi:hypothetical protein